MYISGSSSGGKPHFGLCIIKTAGNLCVNKVSSIELSLKIYLIVQYVFINIKALSFYSSKFN